MSILFQERRLRTIKFYDIGAIIVTRSCYSNKNEISCNTPIRESINFKLQLFVVGTLSTKTISFNPNSIEGERSDGELYWICAKKFN